MKIKIYINFSLWFRIRTFRVEYLYGTFKKYPLRNTYETFKIYLLEIYFGNILSKCLIGVMGSILSNTAKEAFPKGNKETCIRGTHSKPKSLYACVRLSSLSRAQYCTTKYRHLFVGTVCGNCLLVSRI